MVGVEEIEAAGTYRGCPLQAFCNRNRTELSGSLWQRRPVAWWKSWWWSWWFFEGSRQEPRFQHSGQGKDLLKFITQFSVPERRNSERCREDAQTEVDAQIEELLAAEVEMGPAAEAEVEGAFQTTIIVG